MSFYTLTASGFCIRSVEDMLPYPVNLNPLSIRVNYVCRCKIFVDFLLN